VTASERRVGGYWGRTEAQTVLMDHA